METMFDINKWSVVNLEYFGVRLYAICGVFEDLDAVVDFFHVQFVINFFCWF